MDPRRTTLVAALALCVIAGLTLANLVLFHPAGPSSSAAPATHAGSPAHAVSAPADQQPLTSERPLFEPARIDEEALGPLRPVDARIVLEGSPQDPPQPLGGTQAAVPLHPPAASDQEILAVIDEELPAASQMERDVWLEELRDVGPEITRRVLRLWKQQHSDAVPAAPPAMAAVPAPSALPTAAPADPATPAGPADLPPPRRLLPAETVEVFSVDAGLDREQLIVQLGPSLDAMRRARDVILNNVANAGTVGFKRSEVLFREAGNDPQPVRCEDGQGLRMTAAWDDSIIAGIDVAEVRLDPAAGRLERTGRRLDVAISGSGFFQVRRGDELLLTRAGRLSRGAGGELLAGSAGSLPLEPPVVIPDETADVEIGRDGAVLVRLAGQESPFEAGRILVARCADPSALALRGGSLFAATDASGPPHAGTPGSDGLGKLKQGVLEQSNVDLEQEAAAFQRLQVRVDVLSQILSGAIPFASARPMNLVAAPPDEGEDGGPEPPIGPALIEQYLETRQTEREGGPELR